MTDSNRLAFLIAIHLFTALVSDSQIAKPPSNQIVTSNDTAVFNCSLVCSQQSSVTWYITLPSSGRTVTISPYTPLNLIKNIFDIDVYRGTVNECPQGGYFVEQLFVRAKKQLNLMPVQCSTVCFGEDCMCGDTAQVHFSKLGVLNIVPDISQTRSTEGSVQMSSTHSAIVPSSCNSSAHMTTVTLSSAAANPTPQATTTQSK